jgi:hypothetical protein
MANRNSSTPATSSATAASVGQCHTYDNWIVPEAERNTDALFASRVLDISRGTKVIASILCAHIVDLNAIADGAGGVRTLLSESDTEALARLAVLSLDDLHAMAVNQVDALNAKAIAGAQA